MEIPLLIKFADSKRVKGNWMNRLKRAHPIKILQEMNNKKFTC
jgi:hypothetical protein